MHERSEHYHFSAKFKAYLELIRPFTLVAPIVGVIAGALMGYTHNHGTISGVDWRNVFGACVSMVLVNGASNALNGVYDYDIDKVNKPTRPLPSGKVTKDEAYTMSWFMYMVALFRALLTSVQFGALVFAIMCVTVFYSFPPVRFKKRLWLSNISIAFARGLLGIVAAWSVLSDVTHDPDPWCIGFVLMVFLTGSITSKDFTDVKGDRLYGMNTLPVVYGNKKAVMLSAPFLVAAFVMIPVFVTLGWLIQWAMYLIPLLGWALYIIYLMLSGPLEDGKMENSPVWRHMYFMLMALQAGFAVVYIWYSLS